MKSYTVSFVIDVDAESPEHACKIAWESLSQGNAFPPVGTVKDIQTGAEENIEYGEPNPNECSIETICKVCGKGFEPSNGEYSRCPDCLSSQHQAAEHATGVE